MNPQQVENPDPSPTPLRSQRMTADEAKAVIALWQQERFEETGLADRPAVPDVAEGLDVSPEEVHRLLAEVRARRAEQEREAARRRTREQAAAQVALAEEGRRAVELRQQQAAQEASDQRLGARTFGVLMLILTSAALLLWAFAFFADHA